VEIFERTILAWRLKAVNFQLEINGELADRIRAHGVKSYPHECCGALLGRDLHGGADSRAQRQILGLFPLVNRREDSPRNRFSVTAEDVLDAEKTAHQQGLEVVGWYHSHPDHPAQPSEYDLEHAWPWYSYVIVGVKGDAAEEMTSWRLSDDRAEFTKERIEIRQHSLAK
jgi:proteasome lid subunit RPN8/RPN11